MDVKQLQEKAAKAAEKVEKCKKTIERHEKQLDKKIQVLVKAGYSIEQINNDIDSIKWPTDAPQTRYWEACEVESKKDDIKGAKKKLAEAERILNNWNEKLGVKQDKEDFLENSVPQVIKDFLEEWKTNCFKYFTEHYDEYLKFAKKLDKEVAEKEKELGVMNYSVRNKYLKEAKLDYTSVKQRKAAFAGPIVMNMATFRNEAKRLEWLEKTLEEDKKAKTLDLIGRINGYVGEIKDASNLRVNQKGNLDGYITGERGDCVVRTIGAGGYNIKRFHYRTLVQPVK